MIRDQRYKLIYPSVFGQLLHQKVKCFYVSRLLLRKKNKDTLSIFLEEMKVIRIANATNIKRSRPIESSTMKKKNELKEGKKQRGLTQRVKFRIEPSKEQYFRYTYWEQSR